MRNRILFEPFSENFSVKLIAHGDELSSTNIRYRYDNTGSFDSFRNYELGQVLTGGPLDQPSSWLGIQFEINGQSKDSSNYFQFVTSGGFISVQGHLVDVKDSYAFYNLFADCENILWADNLWIGRSTGGTTVGALTEAKKYTYANMFKNCTSLTKPPRMFMNQNTVLKDWCFAGMFNNCKSLSSVPDLPASSLAMCCYNSMFYNCKGLSSVPSGLLSAASELAPFCYNSMFNFCTSLTGAPVLSASTLANGCYKNMFMDCKSLSSITVSFTEWNENCTGNWVKGVGPYGTFNRPIILAEQYGNSKIPLGWDRVLQTITIDQIPTVLLDENNTSASLIEYVHYTGTNDLIYMINGQLPAGITFEDGVFYYDSDQIEGSNLFNVDFIAYALDAKAVITTITIKVLYFDKNSPLTFVGKDSSNAVALSSVHQPERVNLQYSKNSGQWQDYTINEVITFDQNDTIAFSGANDQFSENYQNYYRFKMSGIIESYGNIQSLMNFSDSCTSNCYIYLFSSCDNLIYAPLMPATTLAQGCYAYTFYNCSRLVDAPELPATQLDGGCYQNMFQNCHSLTSVPELPASSVPAYAYWGMFAKCYSLSTALQLPATEIGRQSYTLMFYNCSSLIQAPQISATTLATNCCQQMFRSCTSLTSAPALPATELASGCYLSMFEGCTSLTDAPALPATGLAQTCYANMFVECSNLSTAPILPAITLASQCYANMFRDCTALTAAPALPATRLAVYCYEAMFKDCTSLTSAPALPATGLAKSCYYSMFKDCTSLTSAPALPATKLANGCYEWMFSNCTSLTSAPQLPATTLADSCYYAMFAYCRSLTDAPQLPATELAVGCYNMMFYQCNLLSSMNVSFTDWNNTTYKTDNWVYGVAPTGIFYKPSALPEEYGSRFIPSGWTVTNKQL